MGTGELARPAEQSEAAKTYRANPALPGAVLGADSKKTSKPASNPPAADELVVYEKGKVVFRMKPAPAQPDSTKPIGNSIVAASSRTELAPLQPVWLSPETAETRLLSAQSPSIRPKPGPSTAPAMWFWKSRSPKTAPFPASAR